MPNRARGKDGGTGKISGLYGGDARGLYNSSSRGHRMTMIYGKPPRRWPKILIVAVVLLILVACIWQFACGGLPFLKASAGTQQQTQQAANTATTQQTAQTTQTATSSTYVAGLNTTIKVSALGDCTLGTDPSFDEKTNFTTVYNRVGDPGYFFDNVKKYTSADDLTLCNFEGTLTDSSGVTAAEKTFTFKAPTKYAQILVDGSVEGANMANNHSFDYGTGVYESTKAALKKYGVTSFGYDRTAIKEINGIKVGLFGIAAFNGVSHDKKVMKSDIAELQQQGCALIIGYFHWGIESDYIPEGDQVTLAHAAIDAGCDLVVGGHPHVLQGIEKYNGHYILYSTGNFCFGGNDSPGDFNTMIWQQTFTFKDGQLVTDDTTAKDIGVVPCSVSSSSSVNDFQPTPLTGSRATSLLKKLNGYSAKLSNGGITLGTTINGNGLATLG